MSAARSELSEHHLDEAIRWTAKRFSGRMTPSQWEMLFQWLMQGGEQYWALKHIEESLSQFDKIAVAAFAEQLEEELSDFARRGQAPN